jgi:hypothetical protein
MSLGHSGTLEEEKYLSLSPTQYSPLLQAKITIMDPRVS